MLPGRKDDGLEDSMLTRTQQLGLIATVAVMFAVATVVKSADAAGQASTGGTPSFTPQSKPVAAGENEAKKMLVLMDTDKSGTVSRKEFMDYMAAEFDRLDVNHDGVLDVKELELMRAHQGGGHR